MYALVSLMVSFSVYLFIVVVVVVVVVVRWLQPERSVDMNSIDIQIPEGEHQLGKDISVNIIIKDLTGTVVAVPDMQVCVCLSVCLSVGLFMLPYLWNLQLFINYFFIIIANLHASSYDVSSYSASNKVELLATFIKTSGQEDGAVRTVNPNTGVSPPEFTHKYTAITQGNMKLNAMSAMMVRRPHLYFRIC